MRRITEATLRSSIAAALFVTAGLAGTVFLRVQAHSAPNLKIIYEDGSVWNLHIPGLKKEMVALVPTWHTAQRAEEPGVIATIEGRPNRSFAQPGHVTRQAIGNFQLASTRAVESVPVLAETDSAEELLAPDSGSLVFPPPPESFPPAPPRPRNPVSVSLASAVPRMANQPDAETVDGVTVNQYPGEVSPRAHRFSPANFPPGKPLAVWVKSEGDGKTYRVLVFARNASGMPARGSGIGRGEGKFNLTLDDGKVEPRIQN
jgi:hypothetical protein